MSNPPEPSNEQNASNEDPAQESRSQLPKKIFDALQDIPEQQRERVLNLFQEELEVVYEKVSMWQGPIPHPESLRQLEEVVPGCAKQIIDEFLDQSKHRKTLENMVITEQNRQSGRGQNYGFIIALFISIIGGFLIYTGHDGAGVGILISEAFAIISIFVTGKIFQKNDLDKKKTVELKDQIVDEIKKLMGNR